MDDINQSRLPVVAAYETEVLVAGGGPVGMMMAYQLALGGVSCMMVEQGTRTTSHPKMELLSPRSMEIFRKIGLSEQLRAIAVPEHYEFDEVFSTGLGRKDGNIKTLKRESPAQFRKKWQLENDGSHARDPYLRVSQILVEAWLKPMCEAEPLIDDHWGWTFNSLVEYSDHVLSTVTDAWGRQVVVKSKYVVGCDGAGSRVRSACGLDARRKALPLNLYMVHFQSRDLDTLYSQGDFWHLNFLTGGIVINQDEKETFTFHSVVPPGASESDFNPMQMLSSGFGGIGEPYPIKVERILKTSIWSATTSVANAFRSETGRVFLAGDAAHQLTPAGGNGLNSGIGDTFDLTWKLVSVLRGCGGEQVLRSYNHERRVVAKNNIKRVEEAMSFFIPLLGYAAQVGHDTIHAQSEEGEKARSDIRTMIENARWIHSQEGNWVDYRYNHSPIVIHDSDRNEPAWAVTKITPSTWPGCRAPHVFLSDGSTSIFDLLGPQFSIVDFTPHGEVSLLFLAVARGMNIPIKRVWLPSEQHVHKIWQRDAVLLRPDGHVAWTSPSDDVDALRILDVKNALLVATGRVLSPTYQIPPELLEDASLEVAPEERTQEEDVILPDMKTGKLEQLEDKLLPQSSVPVVAVVDQKASDATAVSAMKDGVIQSSIPIAAAADQQVPEATAVSVVKDGVTQLSISEPRSII